MKFTIPFLLLLVALQFNTEAQVYDVSLADRNKAIELYNLAIENNMNNKVSEVFEQFVKAISIDSTFRNPYLQLYTVSMSDSNFVDQSIIILQKSKKIFQQDDEICYYLGEMYKIKGELKRAMAEYSMAIAYSKMNGEDFPLVHKYYFSRANICLEKNMISTAVLDYTYALNLKPDYGVAYANRGICLFKMEEIEAACKDWEQAVKLGISQSEEYLKKNCNTETAK
ncbi:MAG: hypothetical protein COC06_04885 [Bacteroidales bacterium]|nr:MAG: hypothetical protein COC06_04885 [Bacteroidales bacterium]